MQNEASPSPEMILRPVGVVESELKTPSLRVGEDGLSLEKHMEKIREDHKKIRSMTCRLSISPEYEPLLDGVEEFSHLLVLYWPHLTPAGRRSMQKVHPMGREDVPKRGIFATCSPARPNPILVSAVSLEERRGNVLLVKGLEAVDGSPIVDIKPYNSGYYRVEDPTTPEWLAKLRREIGDEG